MTTTTAVVLAAGALGAGVWIGVKLTKRGVQNGVDDLGDRVIRTIGGDPMNGYGRVAHTIIDTFAAKVLDNG